MHRTVPFVALLLATLLALPAQAGWIGSETKSYTLGLPGVLPTCDAEANRGGACFDVPAGTSAANVAIVDAHGLLKGGAGAEVLLYKGNTLYMEWRLCEDWQWLGVAPGVTRIVIDLHPAGALAECGRLPPAEGSITVRWHDGQQ